MNELIMPHNIGVKNALENMNIITLLISSKKTAKLPPVRRKSLIFLQSYGWQFWWQQVKKV